MPRVVIYGLRILFGLSFSFYLLSLPSSYRRWTHPFHPPRIAVQAPFREEWEIVATPEEQEKLRCILSQPYLYLGKGLQTYAFGSQDGKYVLKLFRFDPCKVSYGQRFLHWGKLRLGMNPRAVLPLDERMEKTFRSCLLSYEKLGDETAIEWVHLNPKKEGLPTIHVQDRLKRWHTIDPSVYRFVIQKRAELLRPALENAYATDREKFHRMVASYGELLLSLEKKGIYNLDPKMASNFGFIGEKAIQIDFGNYTEDEKRALFHPDHYVGRMKGYLRKGKEEGIATLDRRMKEPL